MKTLTKCTLSAAVAAIIATNAAQAAEVVTVDPSLKLTYKNFNWQEDYGSGVSNERDEWVHGVIADFDTGYVNDVIGAVVTTGAVFPLDVQKGSSMANVAKDSRGDADSIGGFQQVYLKAKHTAGDVNLNASYGVKKRGFELYGNSGSRVLAASSEGFDVSAAYGDLNVYASRLTGASNRNQSALTRDIMQDGNKIDNILIYGANYSIAGVGLVAEQLKSQDYLKKGFLMASYGLELSEGMGIDLDARYGTAKRDGNLVPAGYKSKYVNLNATLNVANAFVGIGYNKTKDGDWNRNNGSGNSDVFNSSLDLWDQFANEGEKAYLLTAGYNFADLGLPGLSVDVTTAKGKDAKGFSKFDRREFSGNVSYSFSGDLEGLSVAWYHYDYKLDERADGATATDKTKENGDRVYLTYSVSVF
ncbi:OprD family outer membrane porin [Parendozoicomonas haliclonae]|uniref:Porin-like protein NicP n=1 Tax=Parendozoicomonas haliclonae TaxID=1960125 RepID=A0A1X7AH88_9GAMM|nr:OprD family outer membrane porin [Parendozoicomonas haliclonae]SMA42232.1 Porin-like protein NicP precursor [Parendozoicomonas haliclonae]